MISEATMSERVDLVERLRAGGIRTLRELE